MGAAEATVEVVVKTAGETEEEEDIWVEDVSRSAVVSAGLAMVMAAGGVTSQTPFLHLLARTRPLRARLPLRRAARPQPLVLVRQMER